MTRKQQEQAQLGPQPPIYQDNSQELEDLCNLILNPVTADERTLRDDCLWMDELEFEELLSG